MRCVALGYGAFTSRYVPCATGPEYTPLRWSLLCNRKLITIIMVIYLLIICCCFGFRMSKMSEYTKLFKMERMESNKWGTMNLNLSFTLV